MNKKTTIIDAHVHMYDMGFDPSVFRDHLQQSEITGAVIISPSPASFIPHSTRPSTSNQQRLEKVLSCCIDDEELYPFFWIDPLEDDAVKQVDRAVSAGIKGFKVICDRFYPGHPKAMETFTAVSEQKRPILFHSGILWDGKPSSMYNKPVNFEVLIDIKNLKFSLAHIGWPWTDELIAVYGKFLNTLRRNPEFSCEMFIDTTPGTPPVYREEVLRKLFSVGYDIENNLIFGSDSSVEDYNSSWVNQWVERDCEILEKLNSGNSAIDKIFSGNLKRFLDPEADRPTLRLPEAGE